MPFPFTASFPSPTPSAENVAAFKDLYLRRFGVDLGEEEAWDLATRYLHIFYFGVTPPPAPTANNKVSPIPEKLASQPDSI
jgi:hypothetical protein